MKLFCMWCGRVGACFIITLRHLPNCIQNISISWVESISHPVQFPLDLLNLFPCDNCVGNCKIAAKSPLLFGNFAAHKLQKWPHGCVKIKITATKPEFFHLFGRLQDCFGVLSSNPLKWRMKSRSGTAEGRSGTAAAACSAGVCDDPTSGALLCHYKLSRQSCYMFLLLPFLPH